MTANSREAGKKLRRNLKSAALVVSLALSAYLISVAFRAHHLHWLAWISFLPLFVAVRSLRPPAAMLAGEFWGGCLFLFFVAAATPAVDTPWLLAFLIVSPAVYVALAARSTRPIGFKLFRLADGRALIEAVLRSQAVTNPSPVVILSGARLSFSPSRSMSGSSNVVHWLPSQIVLAILSWSLRQAYPRAPPMPVGHVS